MKPLFGEEEVRLLLKFILGLRGETEWPYAPYCDTALHPLDKRLCVNKSFGKAERHRHYPPDLPWCLFFKVAIVAVGAAITKNKVDTILL